MKEALENLRLLAGIIPMVWPLLVNLVREIEAAVPEPGQGATKLAAVKAFLVGLLAKIGLTELLIQRVWPALEAVVSGLVGVYNTIGVFRKGDKPAEPK